MKIKKVGKNQAEIAQLMTNTEYTHLFEGKEERYVFQTKERFDKEITALYRKAIKMYFFNFFNQFRQVKREFLLKELEPLSFTKSDDTNLLQTLWKSLSELKDLKASHITQIVYTANVGLVVWMTKNYRKNHAIYGDKTMDLSMLGADGLMLAIEAYDWHTNNKFGTFATWWIKQRLSQYRDRTNLIRVPIKISNIQENDKKITITETDTEKQIKYKKNLRKLTLVNSTLTSYDKLIDENEHRVADQVAAKQGEDLKLNDIYTVLDDLFAEYLNDEEIIVAAYMLGFHSKRFNVNRYSKKLSATEIAKITHKDSHRISNIYNSALKKLKTHKESVDKLRSVFELNDWGWNADLSTILPMNADIDELKMTFKKDGTLKTLHTLYNVYDPYRVGAYLKMYPNFKQLNTQQQKLWYVSIVNNKMTIHALTDKENKYWYNLYLSRKYQNGAPAPTKMIIMPKVERENSDVA